MASQVRFRNGTQLPHGNSGNTASNSVESTTGHRSGKVASNNGGGNDGNLGNDGNGGNGDGSSAITQNAAYPYSLLLCGITVQLSSVILLTILPLYATIHCNVSSEFMARSIVLPRYAATAVGVSICSPLGRLKVG